LHFEFSGPQTVIATKKEGEMDDGVGITVDLGKAFETLPAE
jgi:hypothetical protein